MATPATPAPAAAVRAAYAVPGGVVYYSATSPRSPFDWALSDVIGVDVYPDLNVTGDPRAATVPKLVAGWAPTVASLGALSAAWAGQGVLFAESGICSAGLAGLYTHPSYWQCYGAVPDEGVQAKYFTSLFEACWGRPWMAGLFVWKWAWQGGPGDPTFFPLNKSAAGVLGANYGAA